MKRKKKVTSSKRLGILDKVQGVGPERFLSPGPRTEEGSDAEEDFNELLEIKPGTLTARGGHSFTRLDLEPDFFGVLRPPESGSSAESGRGPGKIVSPGDKRPVLPSGYGVPGKTGTGALLRGDLGSVPASGFTDINDLMSPARLKSKPVHESSFIGSLTSMILGRKGGLL